MKTIDRKTVVSAIRKCKKAAGLDYAYSAALADCMSCTDHEIKRRHGNSSKGIWLKWNRVGVNASKWTDCNTYCIVHNLTESQAKTVIDILSQHVKVEWDGSIIRCIEISAKEG